MGAVVVVELAGKRMSLDAGLVSEVAALGTLTPAPLAPPGILGVTQLRGQILPVLDVLGHGLRAGGAPESLVVVERYGVRAAILVDQVIGVEAHAEDLPVLSLIDLLDRVSRQ